MAGKKVWSEPPWGPLGDVEKKIWRSQLGRRGESERSTDELSKPPAPSRLLEGGAGGKFLPIGSRPQVPTHSSPPTCQARFTPVRAIKRGDAKAPAAPRHVPRAALALFPSAHRIGPCPKDPMRRSACWLPEIHAMERPGSGKGTTPHDDDDDEDFP